MPLQSVQSKTRLLLVAVFASLVIISIWHSLNNQRRMVAELAVEMATDKASGYFDGVNTMMLTGTIAQRDLLRSKMLDQENISDLRIIRGDAVTKIFGEGNKEQSPIDDIDRRALAGEKITQFSDTETGRQVTVAIPFKASSNFRGTNCLTCHAVEEGTVLGAVRISYSLAKMDEEITSSLITNSIFTTITLVAGMIMITWFMRQIVIDPLADIHNTITKIEVDYDLRHRAKVHSDDEIGQVAAAFNDMLIHFSSILSQVSNTTTQLDAASLRISSVSGQTAIAAGQQKTETQSVTADIGRLEESSLSLKNSAQSVAEASIDADKTAVEGSNTTHQAIDGINSLTAEIDQASAVISQLDQQSNSVGAVLGVIKNIAEQTNLLALNAAIEAARAGEQGRGFAVVADEVRQLATQSHESTQEIEAIIVKLQSGAKEAVSVMQHAKQSAEKRSEQVHQADQKLKNIVARVTHIRQLNTEMVNATDEQSKITLSVNNSVNNINSLSIKTETDAELTSKVSQDLVNLAAELDKLIHQFHFEV